MSTEYQEELFKEFGKQKGNFEKIADKITEKRKKLYVHAALENVIFAAIIVIMCVVVSFALGVEKGKRHMQGICVGSISRSEYIHLYDHIASRMLALMNDNKTKKFIHTLKND